VEAYDAKGDLWIRYDFTGIVMELGPSFKRMSFADRKAFIEEKSVPESFLAIQEVEEGLFAVNKKDIQSISFLPGNMLNIFGAEVLSDAASRLVCGHLLGVHPSKVSKEQLVDFVNSFVMLDSGDFILFRCSSNLKSGV
jgi:hypothetical protein